MYSHAIFTPGYDGWLDAIDRDIATLKPDSMKGYTVGDNTNKKLSRHPWHLDDEKLVYPAYEKFAKAGLKNVCVHKGLFPQSVAREFPNLAAYADVRDVAKAAKDWPQLDFIIYHGGYRYGGGLNAAEDAWAQFERNGRIDWVTDLAEIPAKYGVTNVYADVGQLFAQSTMAEPRLAAVMMGQLIAGLGADHVCCGAPTPSGPARRSGRSRPCGAWRFPRFCRRSTASSRSARPTGRSRTRSSAGTMRACTAWRPRAAPTGRVTGSTPTRPSTPRVAQAAPTSRTGMCARRRDLARRASPDRAGRRAG